MATKTLQIEKDNAIKAYSRADSTGKKLLLDLFGPIFNTNIFETIKTFEDVCDYAGDSISDYCIPSLKADESNASEVADAYRKRLKLIKKVFNGDWEPNISDTNQYKYYPYFRINPDKTAPGGFRLSCDGCSYVDDCASVGARPYFKDSETAVYVGQQFLDHYEGLTQCESLLHIF